MPGGRNRILDDTKQREVCALVSAGCSLAAAAEYVDCAPNTIRREVARNDAFADRFREARLAAQLNPLRAMQKAAATHWRAAAWMLERGDPEHFARQSSPAFRPKQAQALLRDVLAILSTEIEDPMVHHRIRRQVRQLAEYAIDGVVKVQRTNRDLREVMRAIEAAERDEKLPRRVFGGDEAAEDGAAGAEADAGADGPIDGTGTGERVLEPLGKAQTR